MSDEPDTLLERAVAAGIDIETTQGRAFASFLKGLELGVMLEFKLRVVDALGREICYSAAAELDKFIPYGRGGTNGWIMTTGVTSPSRDGARAELVVKRFH